MMTLTRIFLLSLIIISLGSCKQQLSKPNLSKSGFSSSNATAPNLDYCINGDQVFLWATSNMNTLVTDPYGNQVTEGVLHKCCCDIPEDDEACSENSFTYQVQDNNTDIDFSSNNTTLKWNISGSNSNSLEFTQGLMDCIDSGGSVIISHTDANNVNFQFTATGYTGTATVGTQAVFTGTATNSGSGKLLKAEAKCVCENKISKGLSFSTECCDSGISVSCEIIQNCVDADYINSVVEIPDDTNTQYTFGCEDGGLVVETNDGSTDDIVDLSCHIELVMNNYIESIEENSEDIEDIQECCDSNTDAIENLQEQINKCCENQTGGITGITVERCTGFQQRARRDGWSNGTWTPVQTGNIGITTLDWDNVGSVYTSPACVSDAVVQVNFGSVYFQNRRNRIDYWIDVRLLLNGTPVLTYVTQSRIGTDDRTGIDIEPIQYVPKAAGSTTFERLNVPASSTLQAQLRIRYRITGSQSSAWGRVTGPLYPSVSYQLEQRNEITNVVPSPLVKKVFWYDIENDSYGVSETLPEGSREFNNLNKLNRFILTQEKTFLDKIDAFETEGLTKEQIKLLSDEN